MKLVKSYTAKITGNAAKESKLIFTLSILQQVSEYVFSLEKINGMIKKLYITIVEIVFLN